MKAIKIHELDTGKIIIIKSKDNKAWNRLGTMDKSMIQEVVKHQNVIRCGKTIYQPIY
jgi:hypothetical protein